MSGVCWTGKFGADSRCVSAPAQHHRPAKDPSTPLYFGRDIHINLNIRFSLPKWEGVRGWETTTRAELSDDHGD